MGPLEASKIYRQAVQDFQSKVGQGAVNSDPSQSAFLNMVQNVAKDSVESLESAERMSIQAASGKAGLADVAIAIAHAESTLKTVVMVRDKMIGAYQEIMRMPI
ncbi:MAG: flagellar hook-basal body complex protein FliE [Alphaproteobacteria bacterium]|nr:flagellar hook-basal body complex protein FliE [Alphaproteobacteria bacterium]